MRSRPTDSQVITIDDFRTGERRVVDTAVGTDDGSAGGHGGGDGALVSAFTAALRAGDPSLVPSTAEESLQSHLMVFAAERARRQGTVEAVPQTLTGKPPQLFDNDFITPPVRVDRHRPHAFTI